MKMKNIERMTRAELETEVSLFRSMLAAFQLQQEEIAGLKTELQSFMVGYTLKACQVEALAVSLDCLKKDDPRLLEKLNLLKEFAVGTKYLN